MFLCLNVFEHNVLQQDVSAKYMNKRNGETLQPNAIIIVFVRVFLEI